MAEEMKEVYNRETALKQAKEIKGVGYGEAHKDVMDYIFGVGGKSEKNGLKSSLEIACEKFSGHLEDIASKYQLKDLRVVYEFEVVSDVDYSTPEGKRGKILSFKYEGLEATGVNSLKELYEQKLKEWANSLPSKLEADLRGTALMKQFVDAKVLKPEERKVAISSSTSHSVYLHVKAVYSLPKGGIEGAIALIEWLKERSSEVLAADDIEVIEQGDLDSEEHASLILKLGKEIIKPDIPEDEADKKAASQNEAQTRIETPREQKTLLEKELESLPGLKEYYLNGRK